MRLAVMVTDMVEDFVTGNFGSARAAELIPILKELSVAARENKIPVIYLHDSHEDSDPELKVWGEHAMAGSGGSRIVSELNPLHEDKVIKKHVYSGFFESQLEDLLKEEKVDTLLFTGVSTDICVQHNVADAFYRGYKIYVVTDGTASFDSDTHESALTYMQKIYGAELVNAQEAKKLIESGG